MPAWARCSKCRGDGSDIIQEIQSEEKINVFQTDTKKTKKKKQDKAAQLEERIVATVFLYH